MANTDVDLCSQAFVLLGLSPISSLQANNNKARLALQLYDTVIERLFAEHQWRFAMRKTKLTRLTEVPKTTYLYFYQLPATIQGQPFICYTTADQDARPFKEWQIFEDRLATDALDVWIDHKVTPEIPKWPPYFTQLAVYALAAHFAQPATDDASKTDMWMRIAFGGPSEDGKGGYGRTARALDSMGQPPALVQRDDPFIDVRG